MTARIKISELPPASPLTGAERVPIEQGGATLAGLARDFWRLPVIDEAGASRALALADMGALIRCTAAGGCTVDLPSDATLAAPIGCVVGFLQSGAGQVVLSAGAGATMHVPATFQARTLEQRALIFAIKTAADTWTVSGTLAFA